MLAQIGLGVYKLNDVPNLEQFTVQLVMLKLYYVMFILVGFFLVVF